jgi:hypothetical protein
MTLGLVIEASAPTIVVLKEVSFTDVTGHQPSHPVITALETSIASQLKLKASMLGEASGGADSLGGFPRPPIAAAPVWAISLMTVQGVPERALALMLHDSPVAYVTSTGNMWTSYFDGIVNGTASTSLGISLVGKLSIGADIKEAENWSLATTDKGNLCFWSRGESEARPELALFPDGRLWLAGAGFVATSGSKAPTSLPEAGVPVFGASAAIGRWELGQTSSGLFGFFHDRQALLLVDRFGRLWGVKQGGQLGSTTEAGVHRGKIDTVISSVRPVPLSVLRVVEVGGLPLARSRNVAAGAETVVWPHGTSGAAAVNSRYGCDNALKLLLQGNNPATGADQLGESAEPEQVRPPVFDVTAISAKLARRRRTDIASNSTAGIKDERRGKHNRWQLQLDSVEPQHIGNTWEPDALKSSTIGCRLLANTVVQGSGAVRTIQLQLGALPAGDGQGWQVFVGTRSSDSVSTKASAAASKKLQSVAIWHNHDIHVREWRVVDVNVQLQGEVQMLMLQPPLYVSEGDLVGILNPTGSTGVAVSGLATSVPDEAGFWSEEQPWSGGGPMRWPLRTYHKSQLLGFSAQLEPAVAAPIKVNSTSCWQGDKPYEAQACGEPTTELSTSVKSLVDGPQNVALLMQGPSKVGRVRWRTGHHRKGPIDVKVLVSIDPEDWAGNMRNWQLAGSLGNGFQGAEVCKGADGLSALEEGQLKRFDQVQQGSWHTVTFIPVEGATGVMLQWSACDSQARFSIDQVQLWSWPLADLSADAPICGSQQTRTMTTAVAEEVGKPSSVGADYARTAEAALVIPFKAGARWIDRIGFGADYSARCGNCTTAATSLALQYSTDMKLWSTLGYVNRAAGDMRRMLVQFPSVKATAVRLLLGGVFSSNNFADIPVLLDEVEVYEREAWHLDSCWSDGAVLPILQALPEDDEEELFTPAKCFAACTGYMYAGLVNTYAGEQTTDESAFECRCGNSLSLEDQQQSSTSIALSACNKTCPANTDGAWSCGGSLKGEENYMSVYVDAELPADTWSCPLDRKGTGTITITGQTCEASLSVVATAAHTMNPHCAKLFQQEIVRRYGEAQVTHADGLAQCESGVLPVSAQVANAAANMAKLIKMSTNQTVAEAATAVHRLELTRDNLEQKLSQLVQHATRAQNRTAHLQQQMKAKLIQLGQFTELGSLQQNWAREALVLEKQKRAVAQRNTSSASAPAVEQIKLDLLNAARSLDHITAGVATMSSDSRRTEWAAESIHANALIQHDASAELARARTAAAKNAMRQASWKAEAQLVREAMIVGERVQAQKKEQLQKLRKKAASADRLKHKADQAWKESQLRLSSLRVTLIHEEAELKKHRQAAAVEMEQLQHDKALSMQMEMTLESATENSTTARAAVESAREAVKKAAADNEAAHLLAQHEAQLLSEASVALEAHNEAAVTAQETVKRANRAVAKTKMIEHQNAEQIERTEAELNAARSRFETVQQEETQVEDASMQTVSNSEKAQLQANNEVSRESSHTKADQQAEAQAEAQLKKQQHIALARHKVTSALDQEECDDKTTIAALKKRLGELQAELPAAKERVAVAASTFKTAQIKLSQTSAKFRQSEGSLGLMKSRAAKLSKAAAAIKLDTTASEAAIAVEDQADHRMMQHELVEARVQGADVHRDQVHVAQVQAAATAAAAESEAAGDVAAQLAAKEKAELSEIDSLQKQLSQVQQKSVGADASLSKQEQLVTEDALKLAAEQSKRVHAALTEKNAEADEASAQNAQRTAASSMANTTLALKTSTDELSKLKATLAADEAKVNVLGQSSKVVVEPDEELKIEQLKEKIAQQAMNASQLKTDASMLHVKMKTDAIKDAEEKRLKEIAHEQLVAANERLQQEQRELGEATRAANHTTEIAQHEAAEHNSTAAWLEAKVKQQQAKLEEANADLARARSRLKGTVNELGGAHLHMAAVAAKVRHTQSKAGALVVELANTQNSLDIVTKQSAEATAKKELLEADQQRLALALASEEQEQQHAQKRAKHLADVENAQNTATTNLKHELREVTRAERQMALQVSRVNETASQLNEEVSGLRIQKQQAMPQLKEAQVIADAMARAAGQNSPLKRVAAWKTLLHETNTSESRADAEAVENKTEQFWTAAVKHPELVSREARSRQRLWNAEQSLIKARNAAAAAKQDSEAAAAAADEAQIGESTTVAAQRARNTFEKEAVRTAHEAADALREKQRTKVHAESMLREDVQELAQLKLELSAAEVELSRHKQTLAGAPGVSAIIARKEKEANNVRAAVVVQASKVIGSARQLEASNAAEGNLAKQAAIKAQQQVATIQMPHQLRSTRVASAQAKVTLAEAESVRSQQQANLQVKQKQLEMIEAWIGLGHVNSSITTSQARAAAQLDWKAAGMNPNVLESNVTAVQKRSALKSKIAELNQQLVGTVQDVADAVNETRTAADAQHASESSWQAAWSLRASARCRGNASHQELGNWPDKLGCLEQLSVTDQLLKYQFVTYRSTDGWCEAAEKCIATEPVQGTETFQRPPERPTQEQPTLVLLQEEPGTQMTPMEAHTRAQELQQKQAEAAAAEAEATKLVIELEQARDMAALAHDEAKDALTASTQTLRGEHAAISTKEAQATEAMSQIAANNSHGFGKFKKAEAQAAAAALRLAAAKSSWFRLEELCKVKGVEHEQVLTELEHQRAAWQKLKTRRAELQAQLKGTTVKHSDVAEQKIAESQAKQAISEKEETKEAQLADAEQLQGVSNSTRPEQEIVAARIAHLKAQEQQDSAEVNGQEQALIQAEKAVKAADEKHAAAQQKEKTAVVALLKAQKDLSQLQLKLEAAHAGSHGPVLDEERMNHKQTEAAHRVSELMQESAARTAEFKQEAKRHKAADQAFIASTAREHEEEAKETQAEAAVKTAREELKEAEQHKKQAAEEARQHAAAVSKAELAKRLQEEAVAQAAARVEEAEVHERAAAGQHKITDSAEQEAVQSEEKASADLKLETSSVTALESKLASENSTHGGVSLIGELQAASDQAHSEAAHLATQISQEEAAEAVSTAQATKASEDHKSAEQKSNTSSLMLEDLKRIEFRDTARANSTLLELDRLNSTIRDEDRTLAKGAQTIKESAHQAEDAVELSNKEQREVNRLGETASQLRYNKNTDQKQLEEAKSELESLLKAIEALKKAIDVAQERELSEQQQKLDSLKDEDDAKKMVKSKVIQVQADAVQVEKDRGKWKRAKLAANLATLEAQQQREEANLRLSEERNATATAKKRKDMLQSLLSDLETNANQLSTKERLQEQEVDLDKQALRQVASMGGNRTRNQTAASRASEAEEAEALRERQLRLAEAELADSERVHDSAMQAVASDRQRMAAIIDNRTGLSKQYIRDLHAITKFERDVNATEFRIKQDTHASVHIRMALLDKTRVVDASHKALDSAEKEAAAAMKAAEGSVSRMPRFQSRGDGLKETGTRLRKRVADALAARKKLKLEEQQAKQRLVGWEQEAADVAEQSGGWALQVSIAAAGAEDVFQKVDRLLERAQSQSHDSRTALQRVDQSINSIQGQISEIMEEEDKLSRAVEQASVKAAHFEDEVRHNEAKEAALTIQMRGALTYHQSEIQQLVNNSI